MRRCSRHRLRVAAVVAAATVLASVAGAWGFGGGGETVATFAIRVDGEPVTFAKGYALDAAVVSVDKKAPYQEYTLRLSLALTGNPGPAHAFRDGQTIASVEIDLLSATQEVLRTYELSGANAVTYRQSGNAVTNAFEQELVVTSRSLTISEP